MIITNVQSVKPSKRQHILPRSLMLLKNSSIPTKPKPTNNSKENKHCPANAANFFDTHKCLDQLSYNLTNHLR